MSLAGAAVMVAWRVRESQRPVTPRSLLVPPLGMSTGFCMFFAPQTRVPLEYAAVALVLGATIFAIPLLRGSRLTRVGDRVLMQRSRAFLWILVGLVAVRQVLRAEVEQYLDPLQTGALFYLLAFGMIARWRVQMWRAYKALMAAPPPADPAPPREIEFP